MRRLRWHLPERSVPQHPIRDSALLYAFMGVVIVAVSVATGGSGVRAIVVAAVFWIVAMTWATIRFRRRPRKDEST